MAIEILFMWEDLIAHSVRDTVIGKLILWNVWEDYRSVCSTRERTCGPVTWNCWGFEKMFWYSEASLILPKDEILLYTKLPVTNCVSLNIAMKTHHIHLRLQDIPTVLYMTNPSITTKYPWDPAWVEEVTHIHESLNSSVFYLYLQVTLGVS